MGAVEGPIAFEALDAKPRPTGSRSADWRKELRRRLDQRSGKSAETEDVKEAARIESSAASPEGESEAKEQTPEIGEGPSRLFEYQLKRPSTVPPLSNPVRPQEEKQVKARSPKPVSNERRSGREEATRKSREPAPPVGSVPRPLQRRLKLESQASEDAGHQNPMGEADPFKDPRREPTQAPVSREILLSRFLAGIIDVTVPLALGMSFALVAAWKIGFDFFAYGSLRMALLFSLGFYLFNSLFFLLLSGQTPGMYAAQLSLIGAERKDDVPATSVLLRVILFLPSCLTVVGLLWSIFDSERRCLHDILSGSLVVSRGQASTAGRPAGGL